MAMGAVHAPVLGGTALLGLVAAIFIPDPPGKRHGIEKSPVPDSGITVGGAVGILIWALLILTRLLALASLVCG